MCVVQGGACTHGRGCAVPEALRRARICHIDNLVFAILSDEMRIAQYQSRPADEWLRPRAKEEPKF
jgi:hypothetical protein